MTEFLQSTLKDDWYKPVSVSVYAQLIAISRPPSFSTRDQDLSVITDNWRKNTSGGQPQGIWGAAWIRAVLVTVKKKKSFHEYYVGMRGNPYAAVDYLNGC